MLYDVNKSKNSILKVKFLNYENGIAKTKQKKLIKAAFISF